jgi:hypothetical protein
MDMLPVATPVRARFAGNGSGGGEGVVDNAAVGAAVAELEKAIPLLLVGDKAEGVAVKSNKVVPMQQ